MPRGRSSRQNTRRRRSWPVLNATTGTASTRGGRRPSRGLKRNFSRRLLTSMAWRERFSQGPRDSSSHAPAPHAEAYPPGLGIDMTSGHGADPHPPQSSAPCRIAAAAANHVERKGGAPLSPTAGAAASRRVPKGELLVLHLNRQSQHTF